MTERILAVEDSPAVLKSLKATLEFGGFEFIGADNGAAAMRLIEDDPPDLVLLDLNLPDVSGFTICRRIKGDERLAAVPVVILTGETDVNSRIHALELGAEDYIVKPYHPEALIHRVRNLLRTKEVRDNLIKQERFETLRMMSAAMAHEIRNPLNAISLHVMLLERRINDLSPEEARSIRIITEVLKSEVGRLENFVKDFLLFTRVEGLRLERIELAPFVEEQLGKIADRAREQKVEADFFALASPAVSADRERLSQALQNLFVNALDAMPDGGRLEVAVDAERDEAVVRVRDTGPGIPEEQVTEIHRYFFSTKPNGAGLGLPIVQNILAAHDGRLVMERTSPEGTEFSLRLPLESEINHGLGGEG